jgi:predicted metal-dependent peptidase
MVKEALTKLVVVFDTSGSCFNSQEQVAFVSELASILDLVKPEKVVVLYVDTGVVGDQEFSDGQFAVADIDVRGGGGTDLEVAYDWIEKNGHADTQAVIFFTDGYTDFSNAPSYPVLWVMTTEELAPYGHNIRLTLE